MSSIVKREIEHFSKDSARWWDESGPFKPLHALNPVRLGYIKEHICAHFSKESLSLTPFTGLKILDIGCGGGLVCEPLARLGATVSGADADQQAIDVAKEHAVQSGLEIEYLNKPAEEIKTKFDVVLALEIIEHVEDPSAFVASVSNLVKANGLVIFSTLNRTAKSYALGILAAEYLLQWVPHGTHSWKKFVNHFVRTRS
jgi:2-polyprenyl-6-hydroxyphenyl methylase/3-demethylubiquinone-9 3-methyltransferase